MSGPYHAEWLAGLKSDRDKLFVRKWWARLFFFAWSGVTASALFKVLLVTLIDKAIWTLSSGPLSAFRGASPTCFQPGRITLLISGPQMLR